MRLRALILTLAAAACVSGCAGSGCDGFKPIRPKPADVDVMSDELTGAIVGHNEFGRKQCGWKPR